MGTEVVRGCFAVGLLHWHWRGGIMEDVYADRNIILKQVIEKLIVNMLSGLNWRRLS
jgi:hypothetical protein